MDHWRTPYILPPLPHCLRWLLGYRKTRVPARLSPPAAPGNTFSSSFLPLPPPRRFLLRPPPAGLLGPAPSAPRVWPARGPLLSGAPTQVHGSMKQEEEAERERSRLPRLRLGQEERWETRSAPLPPPPCPPGRPPSSCRRARRASSPRSDRRDRGAGPPGFGERVPGQRWGELPGGSERRRQAGPVGRVCPPGAGGSGGVLGRGVGGRPCPRAARRGRARLQLLSALPPGSSLGSCKVWWSPAPPGGPRPQSHRPLPRPMSGFHPRGSALAALPVAGSSHRYSRRPALSFHPLFLTIHLSLCLFGPSPLWPLLSPLYLALSLLNSLFARMLSPLLLFLNLLSYTCVSI